MRGTGMGCHLGDTSVGEDHERGGQGALVLLLLLALPYPDQSNMRDKAAGVRAIGYPLASLVVPVLWWTMWRDRVSFPWLPDLLVTITCFTDILGNQLDLYDTIVWFDDWMHFMNTGLLATAVILLTLSPRIGLLRTLERALAFGATSAIVWELAEYVAFISRHSERAFAYRDTWVTSRSAPWEPWSPR